MIGYISVDNKLCIMPGFKRKSYSTKPYARSAKRYRGARKLRLSRKGNMRMRGGTNVMTVNRWVDDASSPYTVAGGTSSKLVGKYFTVGDLPDISSFTALFDQYRILKVTAYFRMTQEPAATYVEENGAFIQNVTTFYPDIYVTVDHDDSNTPASVQAVQEYSKCKSGILRPNHFFKYTFHPTALLQMYQSAVATSYATAKPRTWLDAAQTNTPCYGMKFAIDASKVSGSLSQGLLFEVRYRYTIQFKNVR